MVPLLYPLMVAVAVVAGTSWFGWIAVPVLAFAAGAWRGASALVAVGAALGWGALLLLGAARGPLWTLAGRVGGVLGVPAVALVLATVAFAWLLGWSAAVLGGAARGALWSQARPLAHDGRAG